MWQASWQKALRQTALSLQARNRPPRVAVVGVGHELRGDDAAGLFLARAVRALDGCRLPAGVTTRLPLLVLETGPAPENYSGTLRRFMPDLVLLVDAADMGVAPGQVRWVDWRQLSCQSASTHALPLQFFAAYLMAELGCQVALLGIQPASLDLDAPLSAPVCEAVAALALTIEALWGTMGQRRA